MIRSRAFERAISFVIVFGLLAKIFAIFAIYAAFAIALCMVMRR